MKTLILIALSCFFYLAEAQQITFEKTYGSGIVSSMALCSDGGYIVAINQDTVGRYIKLDSRGNVEWERSLDSANISAIAQAKNGEYFYVRTTIRSEQGNSSDHGAVVSFADAQGKVKRSKYFFDHDYRYFGNSVMQGFDGYIVGLDADGPVSDNAFFMFNVDSLGTPSWNAMAGDWCGGSNMNMLRDDRDSTYVAISSSCYGQTMRVDKQSKSGGNVSTFFAPGNQGDNKLEGENIAMTSDGGYIAVGSFKPYQQPYQPYMVKLNKDLIFEWSRNSISAEVGPLYSVAELSGRRFVVTGSLSGGTFAILGPTGNLQSIERYQGIGLNILKTPDCGYLIGGNKGDQAYLLKLDCDASHVGIEESVKTSFEMYPNPNNGTFTINRTSAPIGLVEIYDATGRQVYKEDVKNTQCQLKLTVEPGVYSVKIGSAFKKIVINT